MSFGKEKPNTLQLMEKFNKIVTDVDNLNAAMESAKQAVNKKLAIINTINDYTTSIEKSIAAAQDKSNNYRVIFGHNTDKIKGGNYEIYGQTVHAKYVQIPNQVFNILTETGPLFKGNVKVEIYDSDDGSDTWAIPETAYKHEYKNILKHESDTTKDDVFNIYTKNRITLRITVNPGALLGNTEFDTLEICPYLPGSFDIDVIRLYTIQQYLEQDTILPETFYGAERGYGVTDPFIQDTGNIRVQLDKSYQLYRIEFDIIINYNDGHGYPFGLKHLYFYDTAADTSSNYIITEIDCDDYIESIGEEVALYTANGSIDTSYTASSYGIEYYLFYADGVLDNQVEPNTVIARNVKTFYAKIPLKKPLIGIEFKEVALRG